MVVGSARHLHLAGTPLHPFPFWRTPRASLSLLRAIPPFLHATFSHKELVQLWPGSCFRRALFFDVAVLGPFPVQGWLLESAGCHPEVGPKDPSVEKSFRWPQESG